MLHKDEALTLQRIRFGDTHSCGQLGLYAAQVHQFTLVNFFSGRQYYLHKDYYRGGGARQRRDQNRTNGSPRFRPTHKGLGELSNDERHHPLVSLADDTWVTGVASRKGQDGTASVEESVFGLNKNLIVSVAPTKGRLPSAQSLVNRVRTTT